MKIIEGLKTIPQNIKKIDELQLKILQFCAYYDVEPPIEYGDRTKDKVQEWIQTCTDLTQRNIDLEISIQKTNLQTMVTIELGGKQVTRSISEWILRRRKYAIVDLETFKRLKDKGLKTQPYERPDPTDQTKKIHGWATPILCFDVELRDRKIEEFSTEIFKINNALEIVNATTDIIGI